VLSVQGSTEMWEANPNAMRAALRQHDTLMRRTILENNGVEVLTEGDSFTVAFQKTVDAVNWCMDVQLGNRRSMPFTSHFEFCVKRDWLGCSL
jgi:class 3 adenylate cyclase